jgi:hypothetical protein
MILVVMVGMSLVFAYVAVYADNYKTGVGSSVLESLTLEDVWVDGSQTVHVWVYNSGTEANLGTAVNLNIATIYVDGSALTNNQAGSNYGTINFNEQSVNAGQNVQFIGESSQPIASGTHEITVVTMRGSSFKEQFDVP